MKIPLRELFTDLRAAVLIGIPDGVYTVLDEIRGADEDAIKTSDLYQLGVLLTPLPSEELLSLAQDADPAIRAMTAVGLGERFILKKDLTPEDLRVPASDLSPEVRANLSKALRSRGEAGDRGTLLQLAETWLVAAPLEKHQHLVETGLRLLPAANPTPEQLSGLLAPLAAAPDHAFRAALVETLAELADTQAASVLDVLEGWAQQPDPNVWVISQTLSASWSMGHSPRAIEILTMLSSQAGELRAIRRAIGRHTGTTPEKES